MRQQDVFKKVGGILQELNEQYEYLKTQTSDLNDLELELFAANANFLCDHLEILRKLNAQIAKSTPPLNNDIDKQPAAVDLPVTQAAAHPFLGNEVTTEQAQLNAPELPLTRENKTEEYSTQTDVDQPDNTYQFELDTTPQPEASWEDNVADTTGNTLNKQEEEGQNPVWNFEEPEQHGASFVPNDLKPDTTSDYQAAELPQTTVENQEQPQHDVLLQEEPETNTAFPTFKLPETEFNLHTPEPQQPEYQNPVEEYQEPSYTAPLFEQQQPEQQLPLPEQPVYVEPVYPHEDVPNTAETTNKERLEERLPPSQATASAYTSSEEGSSGINLDADTGQDTFSFIRREEPAIERPSFSINEADTLKSNEDLPAATFAQPEVKPEPAPEAQPTPAAYTPEPTPEPAAAPTSTTPKFVSHTAYPPPPEPAKEPERPLTLNERISAQLGQNNASTAASSAQPIKDLKSAVTLNDKMLFVRDLFNGYSLAYSEAIEILNRFNNFDDASRFLQVNYVAKNNWAAKQATADKFYDLLRRRFA